MTQSKLSYKRLEKEHEQALDELDRQYKVVTFQSTILNKIREILLTNTEWDGTFPQGKDIGDILDREIRKWKS